MFTLNIKADDTYKVEIPVSITGGGVVKITGDEYVPTNNELEVHDSGSFELVFTNPNLYKTYQYKLSQVAGNDAYVIYDDKEYDVTVYFLEKDSGLYYPVVIISHENDELKPDKATWKNTTVEPVYVNPPVKKTIKGNPEKRQAFTFKMEAEDKSFPMPEGSRNGIKTHIIYGDGEFEFGEMEYDQEGVYSYTISEVHEDVEGWTYDSAVYRIIFTVTRVGNKLQAEEEIIKGNQATNEIKFTNEYKKKPTPTPDITPTPTPTPPSKPKKPIINTSSGITLMISSSVMCLAIIALVLVQKKGRKKV